MTGAYVWAAMMLVWLLGLIYGAWWVWPLFTRPEPGGQLAVAIFWLGSGVTAWLIALNLGLARYRRR